jgi:hypothetical protein
MEILGRDSVGDFETVNCRSFWFGYVYDWVTNLSLEKPHSTMQANLLEIFFMFAFIPGKMERQVATDSLRDGRPHENGAHRIPK